MLEPLFALVDGAATAVLEPLFALVGGAATGVLLSVLALATSLLGKSGLLVVYAGMN